MIIDIDPFFLHTVRFSFFSHFGPVNQPTSPVGIQQRCVLVHNQTTPSQLLWTTLIVLVLLRFSQKERTLILFLFLRVHYKTIIDLTLLSYVLRRFESKAKCVNARSYFCYLMCRKQINENDNKVQDKKQAYNSTIS